MSKHVYIVLAEGFETVEALAPADALIRAGLNVTLVSTEKSALVHSSHGIGVECDAMLDACNLAECDLLVVPGGAGVSRLSVCQPLLDALIWRMGHDQPVAAICAAPSILAHLGLLQGRVATCYPGFETEFPAGVRPAELGTYVDGNLVTASGPAFALEFGLACVELLLGPEAKHDIAEKMLAASFI